MIITDDFVLINFPKTGSTFARQVVLALYGKRRAEQGIFSRLASTVGFCENTLCKELYFPETEYVSGNTRIRNQHGRYEQLPRKYASNPVLSIVRDPAIRNVSFYEYGWWKNVFAVSREEIDQLFPGFPDLDFKTYLKFQKYNSRLRDTGIRISDDIGEQTVTFIQYFFKSPKDAFKKLDDKYINSGVYMDDMPRLQLLSTERLNEELHRYLKTLGFTGEELAFIDAKQPVRPEETQRKSVEERREYLTDEIVDAIRHDERYLYRIYSDFGIHY